MNTDSDLARLNDQPRLFWLVAAGLILAAIGCLAPWSSESFGSHYGFQSDDGKFFLLVLFGLGALLWRYADGRAQSPLAAIALIGLLLVVAAGLEFKTVQDLGDQADGLMSSDEVGSSSATDSWGLLLVVLGALGVSVGTGLLALENSSGGRARASSS